MKRKLRLPWFTAMGVATVGFLVAFTPTVSGAATSPGSGVVTGTLSYAAAGPSYCAWSSSAMVLIGTLDTGMAGTIDLGPWTETSFDGAGVCESSGISGITGVTYSVMSLTGSSVSGTCSGTFSPTDGTYDAATYPTYDPTSGTLQLTCSSGGTGALQSFALTISGDDVAGGAYYRDINGPAPEVSEYPPFAGSYTME